MKTRLPQICPLFSPETWKNTSLLVKESVFQPANFFIADFMNMILQDKKNHLIFIGVEYNFAHYLTILKKLGCNLTTYINNETVLYIDCFNKTSDWIISDLPMTEEIPLFWKELPPKIENFMNFFPDNLDKMFEKIVEFSKNREKIWIIIDNLDIFFEILNSKETSIEFIQTLFELKNFQKDLFNICIVTTNDYKSSQNFKTLQLLELNCQITFEVMKNPSGFSKDIDGIVIFFSFY